MMDDVDRWLALARAPGLHLDHLRAAGALAAPPQLVGRESAELSTRGIPAAAAAWLAHPEPRILEADRRWLERAAVTLLGCDAERYPPLLAQIAAAPVALYVRGDATLLSSMQLAIVGSRSPTASGARTARDFAAFLARAGLTITSGLAIGIDAAAHAGALAGNGRTIAVFGSGLDQVYPPENAGLADRILAPGGALLTEFPPGTAPLRGNFPRRNRLISGLSLGTLVVEAARHSGSLITARLAGKTGPHALPVPGASPKS